MTIHSTLASGLIASPTHLYTTVKWKAKISIAQEKDVAFGCIKSMSNRS